MKLTVRQRILIAFDEVGRTIEDPYRAVWERLNLDESVSRRTVRTTMDRLKRAGELERIQSGDAVVYRLTDGGRHQVVRYTFSKRKWDGRWHLVMFDIPETKRRARDVLRERLWELGFRQFQESVWIAPFDILDEVRDLRSEYGVAGHVKLLTVEVIEDYDRLMRRFGLETSKKSNRLKRKDDTNKLRS